MILKNKKIRLLTALLATLMLMSSCAVNRVENILPSVDAHPTVSESDKMLQTLPPKLPIRENNHDVTEDVSRPAVGSSGASKKFLPYSVPLTVEQQKIVEKVAERFWIDEELIYGVMWVESKYNVNAIGKNANYL